MCLWVILLSDSTYLLMLQNHSLEIVTVKYMTKAKKSN